MEAVAGLRPKLKKDGAKRPGGSKAEDVYTVVPLSRVEGCSVAGTRLLPGKFMAVEQAAATKKGRVTALQIPAGFLHSF